MSDYNLLRRDAISLNFSWKLFFFLILIGLSCLEFVWLQFGTDLGGLILVSAKLLRPKLKRQLGVISSGSDPFEPWKFL